MNQAREYRPAVRLRGGRMAVAGSLILLAMAPLAAAGLIPEQQREMVEVHNRWRAQVNVADLGWSEDLAQTAQSWADRLRVNNGCGMRHSERTDRGENLFWASAVRWSDGRREVKEVTPSRVTDAWGAEKVDYNPARNGCRSGRRCGHYTQIIWRATTELGCALALCPDKSQVWVCHYRPAGNRIGEPAY
ncbi:MAG: SCP-like extracellular [Gammaproteobacteria bacterium]|nr:SCP-like extracellular [Gammaproteobacteria bacterium]MBU1655122.1 SCP-like extracellular [Gammaproteobacteria bacterium]MBU1961594.1 SCP-like extracellular [Gammaproteobacteria bacterium]